MHGTWEVGEYCFPSDISIMLWLADEELHVYNAEGDCIGIVVNSHAETYFIDMFFYEVHRSNYHG